MLKTSLLIAYTFSLAMCGNNSGGNTTAVVTAPSDTTNKPVETKRPNSNYKPAFAGQTRIIGVHTKTRYQTKVLTSDLSHPWGITTLPDGRFLITQKGGTMRIATADGKLS